MCVVDLHDVELLYDLVVDSNSFLLECRHNPFTKIDCNDVVEDSQAFNLFVSLYLLRIIRILTLSILFTILPASS